MKNTNMEEHIQDFLLDKTCNLEVSRRSHAKQQQRNVQKSVLHKQSCFFADYDLQIFFVVLIADRHLVLRDFIFCLSISILTKALLLANPG